MTVGEPDLLDLLHEQEAAADPRAGWVHVLMPNMAYACGGGPLGLADGGPRGLFRVGTNASEWPQVTCPECRAGGLREVLERTHRQQVEPDHVCPPPEEIYPAHRCWHWQSIPED